VQGKGGKDRYTMLSTLLLEELRGYYRKYRPKTYLFPSSFKTRQDRPLSYESLRGIYEKARKKAGVHTGAGLHTLRHCFALFSKYPTTGHARQPAGWLATVSGSLS